MWTWSLMTYWSHNRSKPLTPGTPRGVWWNVNYEKRPSPKENQLHANVKMSLCILSLWICEVWAAKIRMFILVCCFALKEKVDLKMKTVKNNNKKRYVTVIFIQWMSMGSNQCCHFDCLDKNSWNIPQNIFFLCVCSAEESHIGLKQNEGV